MVTAEGKQKDMRNVLRERGVNTHGMNADKLRELLREYEIYIYCRISQNRSLS